MSQLQERMKNPVLVIPASRQALLALWAAAESGGVPSKTLTLVQIRSSQINGCSVCIDMHCRHARRAGETDERLFAIAAWRDAPYFGDEERAALALTEAVTRIADKSDPVPDAIWEEAARNYDERGLASLVLAIGVMNFINRVNVATRGVAGEWLNSPEGKKWAEAQAS